MNHPVSFSVASVATEAPRLLGETTDLPAFVRENYAAVWRTLRRLGLSPSDADDGAQQVFVVIARRFCDIELGRERAFLFRTAMNVASKAHRARRRRPEDATSECDDMADSAPIADDLVDRRRARALLDRLLAQMDETLTAVLVLFEIEGLTMAEIAEVLDVPAGTVASRLRRARAELEAQIARVKARSKHEGVSP
jgi:RNA polymerase sigma-70 factor (ECF subfamily)